MKPLLALLGIAILSSSLEGAVAEGENLLINGGFDAEQVDFPEFWSPSSAQNVIYNRVGGPEGKKPSIVLKSDGATTGTVSLRQQGMTLVAGETYKLSAYIKTKGLESRAAGLVIHNSGWISAVGISKLPADSDWTFHEKTFTLIPSKNKEYGLAMYASGLTGEIHLADVRLEAVSQGARDGSTSQMPLVAAPRLVPLQPLLNKIPRAEPELTFQLYGLLPEKQLDPEFRELVVELQLDRIDRCVVEREEQGAFGLQAVLDAVKHAVDDGLRLACTRGSHHADRGRRRLDDSLLVRIGADDKGGEGSARADRCFPDAAGEGFQGLLPNLDARSEAQVRKDVVDRHGSQR